MFLLEILQGGREVGPVGSASSVIGSRSALAMSVHPIYFDLAMPLTVSLYCMASCDLSSEVEIVPGF